MVWKTFSDMWRYSAGSEQSFTWLAQRPSVLFRQLNRLRIPVLRPPKQLLTIAQQKEAGFEYADYLEAGVSEENVLPFNGRRRTVRDVFLGLSREGRLLPIDLMHEKPNLDDYFGLI